VAHPVPARRPTQCEWGRLLTLDTIRKAPAPRGGRRCGTSCAGAPTHAAPDRRVGPAGSVKVKS
jgi:hypothetical protein